mgnify:CR=1 FL=1
MKVKELFEVVDAKATCPDITIVNNNIAPQSAKEFICKGKSNYIDEMLEEFGDSTIEPNGVVFGTDSYTCIDYIIIQVK